ncbi:geranylgeranylglyceryl/heptaprenylglyceryl phosphate synthase [Methanopyrus sp. KOL6]|uniref:geranylgeranylglyceryl/heptaprenylglyceryl phosphate synthase n=1 Tax=Methanopyrus sp. KOL6 TaxID=1937004 RepID=UPI000B4B1E89|nr:geranylgeranylglyceryl/heptaprenylglyceryl phosphate synthase [Methanopyrus sp. KOL6]
MGVFGYLRERAPCHLTLLDPVDVGPEDVPEVLEPLVEAGTDAVMVGGSTAHTSQVEAVVEAIRKVADVPVILFPNGPEGLAPNADAVLFMSLLNSRSTYYLIEAQVKGAPLVERFGLESIPTGYLIVGEWGTTVSVVGDARVIPFDRTEIIVAHALAAKHLGMKAVYLEAGSGAPEPVPPEVVRKVSGTGVFTIVGGGIRNPETALEIVEAGADAVVTGTAVERDPDLASEIVEAVKRGV